MATASTSSGARRSRLRMSRVAAGDDARPRELPGVRRMEILETQVYRGANYWAPVPVIRFLLDIGELEERPTNQIPGFYEKLTTTLPTMYDHRCSVGKPGGFFQRLREGTWMGHVVEHTT